MRTIISELGLLWGKRSIGIKFESLPASEQPKMLAAMAKEWAKLQQLGATKPITHAEFQKAKKDGVRVIGTRWVLTKKDDGYKARLVVQGCQEDRHKIRYDAPCRLTPLLLSDIGQHRTKALDPEGGSTPPPPSFRAKA